MAKQLQIGPYKLTSNLLLAPMAGITDRPYRDICRSFGAGLAASEMIASDTKLWTSKKTSTRFISKEEAEPRCAQLVGTDPKIMAEAAKRCVDQGVQILDINMGCPAKKVCSKAAGSALMQYPNLVEEILSTVVSAVDIPVTLKTRTGWSRKHKNVLEIAKIAEGSGIQAFYIHGRTRQDAYTGHAEYETIRHIKENINIPVIANGDILTAQDAKFVLEYTQADGLLLGRVTQGNPWIFQEINHCLNNEKAISLPTRTEKITAATSHLTTTYQLYSPACRQAMVKKRAAHYFSNMSTHKTSAKKKRLKDFFAVKCPSELLEQFPEILEEFTPYSQKPASQKQR